MEKIQRNYFKIAALSFMLAVAILVIAIDAKYLSLPQLRSYLPAFPWVDKACHFLIATVLAFLLQFAFSERKPNRKFFTIPFLILLMAVTLEEYSQSFIPSREFSLGDMCSNWAGLFFGGMIGYKLSLWRALRVPQKCQQSPVSMKNPSAANDC